MNPLPVHQPVIDDLGVSPITDEIVSDMNIKADQTVMKVSLILSWYVDVARAKSEALVNNTCKQKKLNRVMLNGNDIENGFKTNRSNKQKKNESARAAHFFF